MQTPDYQVEDIGWLWINGTASDDCSGINRVEIWINGTYLGDAELSEQSSRQVTWWWYTDPWKPTSNIPSGFWKEQCWYYVEARAYDSSVNDEEVIKRPSDNLLIPKTNSATSLRSWFFLCLRKPVISFRNRRKPMRISSFPLRLTSAL